jgi:hypothetical protein
LKSVVVISLPGKGKSTVLNYLRDGHDSAFFKGDNEYRVIKTDILTDTFTIYGTTTKVKAFEFPEMMENKMVIEHNVE